MHGRMHPARSDRWAVVYCTEGGMMHPVDLIFLFEDPLGFCMSGLCCASPFIIIGLLKEFGAKSGGRRD